jgi:uncharacterized protein (DUF1697 family)
VSRVVAFLRGINLGGHNKVRMADLRAAATDAGFSQVETLLQTGNLLLDDEGWGTRELASAVGDLIEDRFGLSVAVILRSGDQLARVLGDDPFLEDEDNLSRLHIVFLEGAPEPSDVASIDLQRSPSDRFQVVDDVIYLHYPNGMGRSKLTLAYLESKLRRRGTARNRNTVLKVADKLGSPGV